MNPVRSSYSVNLMLKSNQICVGKVEVDANGAEQAVESAIEQFVSHCKKHDLVVPEVYGEASKQVAA